MKKILFVVPLMAISLLACNNGGDKPDPTEYTLTLTLNDCNVNGKSTYSKKYAKGLTIDDVIVSPNANYVLKDDSINDTYKQYWSASTEGSYVLSGLTMNSNHDITITASSVTPPEPTGYNVSATCNHGTVSGNESPYKKGDPVSLTFTADPNYVLPASVDEFDKLEGIDESAVTYDNTTGSLTFTMPANLVIITLTANEKPEPPTPTEYDLEVTCTYCSPSGNEPKYEEGKPVLFTITPDPDYELPTKEGIEVSGVTNYEYTITSGVATFSCTMPANKVTVTVTAKPVTPPEPTGEWTLKLDDTSKAYGNLKFKTQTSDSVIIDEFIGETSAITMTFIPGDDYKTTQFTITADDTDVTVENYLPPQSQSGEGSFSIQKTDGFADGDVITLSFAQPTPPVTEYSISMKTEGTTISPTTMDVGEPYSGTITVTNNTKILDGDESLKSVKLKTSGENITSYCTNYNPSDDYSSATFTIPSEYITDDIEVEVTLKDKPTGTATVIWYDENGTDVLETDTDVTVGEHPQYNGKTPYKPKDATNVYPFSGWDPDPTTYVVKGGINSIKAKYDPVPLTELRGEIKIVIPETSENLTFGFRCNTGVEATIDWGDETVNKITNYDKSHTYAESGTYNVSVYGENITEIGRDPYNGKEFFTEIQLMEGITNIPGIAFQDCFNLLSATIPNSIISIGTNAFWGSNKLEYEIHDECKYLGNNSNKHLALIEPCEDSTITSTIIHNDCKVIMSHAFSSCRLLSSVTIPDGITKIEDSTFANCSSLSSINIPNNVTSIGTLSFSGCTQLSSVTFGDSPALEKIARGAFGGCSKLAEVDLSGFDAQYYEELPVLEKTAFYGYPEDIILYVKNAWMQALFTLDDVHGWNQFDPSSYIIKETSTNNL